MEARPVELSDEAVKILCLSIAAQAAKDYMSAYKSFRKAENRVEEEKLLYGKECKQSAKSLADAKAILGVEQHYLMSQQFQYFVEVEPTRLIRLLKEEVDKKMKPT